MYIPRMIIRLLITTLYHVNSFAISSTTHQSISLTGGESGDADGNESGNDDDPDDQSRQQQRTTKKPIESIWRTVADFIRQKRNLIIAIILFIILLLLIAILISEILRSRKTKRRRPSSATRLPAAKAKGKSRGFISSLRGVIPIGQVSKKSLQVEGKEGQTFETGEFSTVKTETMEPATKRVASYPTMDSPVTNLQPRPPPPRPPRPR